MKYKGFDYELKENDGKWTFVLTHTKYSEDADTKEDAIRKVQDYIDNNLVSNMEKFKEKVLAYKNKFKKESYKAKESVDEDDAGDEIKDMVQLNKTDAEIIKYITKKYPSLKISFIKSTINYMRDMLEENIKPQTEEMNYQKGMRVRTDEGPGKITSIIGNGKFKVYHVSLDKGKTIVVKLQDLIDLNESVKEIPQDEIDKITMDVPLLTRMLEYFNENSMDDVKLHKILENLIRESKNGVLGIGDYENIIRIEGEEEPIKAEEERYDNISQDKLDEIIKYIEENKNRSNLILKAAIKHYFNEEIDEADILKYKKGIETKTESEKTDTIEVDGEKIVVVISGSGNKAVSTEDNRHFAKVDDKWVIDFTEKYAKQEKKESVIVIFNRSVDKDKVRDFKRDADKALGYNFIENDNEPYLFTFNDMDENIVKGLLKRNNLQRGDFQIKTKVNTYEKLKQLKEKLKK